MNRSFLLLLLFQFILGLTTLFSNQEELSMVNAPLYVSLGPECHLSHCLKQFGYRKASYPFDWLLTQDHDRMIELLEDDFKYFLDDTYYSIHTNGHLIHNYYHIEFRHEHDHGALKTKFARRINRFRELDRYAGKVFFMRRASFNPVDPTFYWPNENLFHISFESALQFKQALKKRFPNANFNLVVVNYANGNSTMQIIDDIIVFTIPPSSDYCLELKEVFDALNKYAEDPLSYDQGTEISL